MGIIFNQKDYPRTRKQAKELGEKFYMTGVKCARGHESIRRTSTGTCFSCESEKNRKNKWPAGGKCFLSKIEEIKEKGFEYKEVWDE